MDYKDYQHLAFDHRPNGVLLVTLNRPEAANATNARLHLELSKVWRTIAEDAETRVVLITGAGNAFSAGGDFDLLEEMPKSRARMYEVMREATEIVYGMLDLEKPIVSAINGAAVGAGLAVALMADISVISESARLTDGHLRLGIVAGDHAVIIWPLLCGMAKAKYYLLTADFLDGKEAERIGLVSLAVPREQVLERASAIADQLAAGSQPAIRYTKRALNHWIRQAAPAFDASAALEFMTIGNEDFQEGLAALKERRAPDFRMH